MLKFDKEILEILSPLALVIVLFLLLNLLFANFTKRHHLPVYIKIQQIWENIMIKDDTP